MQIWNLLQFYLENFQNLLVQVRHARFEPDDAFGRLEHDRVWPLVLEIKHHAVDGSEWHKSQQFVVVYLDEEHALVGYDDYSVFVKALEVVLCIDAGIKNVFYHFIPVFPVLHHCQSMLSMIFLMIIRRHSFGLVEKASVSVSLSVIFYTFYLVFYSGRQIVAKT